METQIAVRVAVAALSCVCGAALAQSTVTYGRITAVKNTTVTNKNAQVGGALVGGTIGLVSGSGRSSSNQALRGIGGAAPGSRSARPQPRSRPSSTRSCWMVNRLPPWSRTRAGCVSAIVSLWSAAPTTTFAWSTMPAASEGRPRPRSRSRKRTPASQLSSNSSKPRPMRPSI